jgi:predicted transcriptional regulator
MSETEKFLDELMTFIDEHGLTESKFGTMAVSDPSLIRKIRDGRSVSLKMVDRLRAFMRSYHPHHPKKSDGRVAA